MTNSEAILILKQLQEETPARPAYHRTIMAAIQQLEKSIQSLDHQAPEVGPLPQN